MDNGKGVIQDAGPAPEQEETDLGGHDVVLSTAGVSPIEHALGLIHDLGQQLVSMRDG